MATSQANSMGLFACIAVVAGNMMGSGIALLPANLAGIGSISIIGWAVALVGSIALAYVFSRLGMEDPQEGGPIAYAGEVAPILGYQSGMLYYNANWIQSRGCSRTPQALPLHRLGCPRCERLARPWPGFCRLLVSCRPA